MQDQYRWDPVEMEALKQQTIKAYEALNKSLVLMNTLCTDIDTDTAWYGEHKIMFAAWMDLLHQYHAKLADSTIGEAAKSKLDDFIYQSSNFYSNSESMTSLRSIS